MADLPDWVYAVVYVDVLSASKAAAVAELKRYRDASRKEEGSVRLELLEQIGSRVGNDMAQRHSK